jgi:hypothetical protein
MIGGVNNSSKNIVYTAVLGIITVVVAVVLLKNYVFTGSGEILVEEHKPVSANSTRLSNKKLDISFFSDARYKALQDYSIKPVDIKTLETGKKNPFVSDEIQNND